MAGLIASSAVSFISVIDALLWRTWHLIDNIRDSNMLRISSWAIIYVLELENYILIIEFLWSSLLLHKSISRWAPRSVHIGVSLGSRRAQQILSTSLITYFGWFCVVFLSFSVWRILLITITCIIAGSIHWKSSREWKVLILTLGTY